jgi:hypothetical protein
MGFFGRLKAAHHYTSTMVTATVERDDANKKLGELRSIISSMEQSEPEWQRHMSNEPRLIPIYTAFEHTLASSKRRMSRMN